MSSCDKVLVVLGLVGMSTGLVFAANPPVTSTGTPQVTSESSEPKVIKPVKPKNAEAHKATSQHATSRHHGSAKPSGHKDSGKSSGHHHASSPPGQGSQTTPSSGVESKSKPENK